MAYGNFFKDAFGKAKSKLEGFLYHEDTGISAPPPSMSDENAAPGTGEMYPAQQQQTPLYGYQQPYQPQQPVYQGYPSPAYQTPQQAYQQQPQDPAYQPAAYQPPAPAQSTRFARNRRTERTPLRQENNVVDFSAYQQPAQAEPAPAAPQAPQAQPAAAGAAFSARIINARGMADCRSAITLLRNGDTVLIVLENISEPAEMRRLVDTLSGACYSLTATITKVSRYGVYLLAPQTVAVYADQATNQMNMVPSRMPQRPAQGNYGAQPVQRPAYQQPAYAAPAYAAPAYQPAAAAQPGVYAPPQSAFTQRTAAPEEAAAQQPFYARQPVQGAQLPPFSSQPAGYGYAPDESTAAEQ